MGGQQGSFENRERLKDLSEMVKICTSQIRRYKHVEEHCVAIMASYDVDIKAIKIKKSEVAIEYADAPQKLKGLRRQLDKLRAEQDKITGHVSGRTKLVEKYKKAKAELEALEAKLSDAGLDVENIRLPDDDETSETSETSETEEASD